MKVYTVTRNKYKFRDLKRELDNFGVELEWIEDDSPELQAETCEEVVEFSSKYLCNKFGKPIVKLDFGFFIKALSGLPGVYAKDFNKKLGLKVMEGVSEED